MSEDEVCAVCWDTFKCPKLLPCKHSFCLPCLYKYRERLNDKSNMVCPLCREPCFVPNKGFEEFPTNYFAEAEKIPKQCQECKEAAVSKVCYRCYSFLCVKCFLVHVHIQPTAADGDEDEDGNISSSSSGLLSFRRHPNTKTELMCEQTMIFLPEYPPEQDERNIRSLSFSHSGGVYVNLPNSKYLFKCNKHGAVIGKMPFLHVGVNDVSVVLEISLGNMLVAHFSLKAVARYEYHNPDYKHFQFAETLSFHPLGLSELSNGNIVIGGPTHLCVPKCRENSKQCETESKSYGVILIVSKTGDHIKEISEDNGKYIHKFPIYIASSQRFHTFAVCDLIQKKVVIYENNGGICSTFEGTGNVPYSFLVNIDALIPTAVCTTADGNYIVSDPRLTCLHVLNPYGKYIGSLHCENGDDLAHTNALCVDSKNNIWVGHKLEGTVTVLKTKCYKNVFDTPVLPFLGNGLDLPGLGNIDWLRLLGGNIADN